MAKRKSSQSLEDTFAEIGDIAIVAAEAVDCSLADFAEGLKQIEHAIRERRQLAESEVESQP